MFLPGSGNVFVRKWQCFHFIFQPLEQYAYHISIGMDVFIVWLGVVTMLVLLTILQQVIQAARQNPAEVIKSE